MKHTFQSLGMIYTNQTTDKYRILIDDIPGEDLNQDNESGNE
jgi:hypothetical protein